MGYKVSKWPKEIHSILIREVKQAQFRLNLLIGMSRITLIHFLQEVKSNEYCDH